MAVRKPRLNVWLNDAGLPYVRIMVDVCDCAMHTVTLDIVVAVRTAVPA